MRNFLTEEGLRELTSLSSVSDINFLIAMFVCLLFWVLLKIVEKYWLPNEDFQAIKIVSKIRQLSIREIFDRAFSEYLKLEGLPPRPREEMIVGALRTYRWAYIPLFSWKYKAPEWVRNFIRRELGEDRKNLKKDLQKEESERRKRDGE